MAADIYHVPVPGLFGSSEPYHLIVPRWQLPGFVGCFFFQSFLLVFFFFFFKKNKVFFFFLIKVFFVCFVFWLFFDFKIAVWFKTD